ncbi:MAG TPA: hypothetical protein VF548_09070 [Allosphingosinicella sp.]|jgi:hypothetical protein
MDSEPFQFFFGKNGATHFQTLKKRLPGAFPGPTAAMSATHGLLGFSGLRSNDRRHIFAILVTIAARRDRFGSPKACRISQA